MKSNVLKIARLPDMLTERLYADYQVVEGSESGTELGPAAADILVLVANGESRVSRELIGRLPALDVIVVFGVGYDGVDVAAAHERGIAVTHTPDVLTDDVADFAMTLMLGIARRVTLADRFVREGAWAHGSFPFTRKVSGARLGIVGLGRIGAAIARRAEGFDMQIAYCGRRPHPVDYPYFASVRELAATVDFLVVSASGGADTRHLIDTAVLDALGPEGILINVGRGSVVDEAALAKALAEKRLLGAALDVFENEPHVHPGLLELDNVLLTPHMASATWATRRAMSDLVMANLQAYFAGQPLPSLVPESRDGGLGSKVR
ncbi:2-hydroxyacid dehydrogenase [Azomonas macrocytogenes]|uniref:Lactate dehydrogenase-like 2-hydroxyacid dehydrogenase n=1 Tax=Azomonas macrocytogenes TaxID=69962 RepID=A0A839T9A1_AZOMA|nr:2-hydroxyacid dehydrogenase [Azomonas macrocytogenes]MBB3104615.1 lactate dehydrogenase-like 2-hydroxyacid dehydrogenase [Azomonas macrocytogenes]